MFSLADPVVGTFAEVPTLLDAKEFQEYPIPSGRDGNALGAG